MKEKEVKQLVLQLETAISQTYTTFNLGEPTRKIRRAFSKASKRIGKEIKHHLKDQAKREDKEKKAAIKSLKAKSIKKVAAGKSGRTGNQK